MKMKKRVLPALVLSAFAAFGATEAQSSQFSAVYAFGDSLSDAGYYRGFLLGVGLPPATVAAMGRFTTNPGLSWVEYVAQYYGVPALPSNVSGGTIYAQGGARVAAPNPASTPPGFAQRPVTSQIDEFLAVHPAADPNALYTVWAGANDVFVNLAGFQAGAVTQAELQANVLGAATAQIQQIARLRAAGARYIMVATLPDIGTTPAFAAAGAATQGAVTALSAGYNTTLLTGLAGAGIRVIPVDAFSLLSEVRANPGAFGITNVTGVACGPFPPFSATPNSLFCNPSNTVPGGADNYLFADGVHPTTAANRIVAQFATSLIEGPSQHGLLAEAALRTRAGQIHAIGDGVIAARQSDVGGIHVFAGLGGTEFDIEARTGDVGLDSRTNSATIGVAARASEAVTVGAAYGRSRNRGTFGTNAGGYNAAENVWSLFASMKWGRFYGTGIVSVADLDFTGIHRHITLGSAIRRAEANAEGSNGSAHLTAGYDFTFGRLTIGPTVAVTTQNVTVNGFDESGAGAASLRIHEQKRKSEVWSGGLRASMSFGRWTPWLRVTADKERRDEVRMVTATPLTLATIGNSYDVPTYTPDTTFTTGAIGVNGWISERVSLSVAAFKVQGRSGIDESGASAMLSVRF